MNMMAHTKTIVSATLLAGLLSASAANLPHQLGPTGLKGNALAKGFAVAEVAKDSPAAGKINVGETIVGAGGVTFKADARRDLADAIDRAESEKEGGR